MKTKEELDLLLEDLSSRLPYGVQIEFSDGSIETLKGIWYDEDEGWQVDGENTSTCLHAVKPLLPPLSSMTETQLEEFEKCGLEGYHDYDWYNKNHFDYRGLIEKDLAKNLEEIIEVLDTSDLLSLEELRERSVKQPEEVSKGIYKLPVDFLNTTEEDYKKIKGKCFIRELGEFIVIRVEDIISPQYSEFLYEQYEQHSDGSWNCKDYNWLQGTAVYYPEYRKYCLTDQTDMNIGSEEMYCLGKDGNLYVTLECGDEWLRFIPFDLDKFEKIKEEALRNFEEENGYDL